MTDHYYITLSLIRACNEAMEKCKCSFLERHSGHLTECFVPDLQEAVEEANEALDA